LNSIRKRTCPTTGNQLSRDQAAMELAMRYYDQLTIVEEKLPVPAQVPVAFKWNDAFDKGNRLRFPANLTATDVSFEKAAVLFNCGAMMSAVAAQQVDAGWVADGNGGDDDKLKLAAKLFQQAAGVFAQLGVTVGACMTGRQSPTTDLLGETLQMLSTLMLAQAQEAIYIKASKDSLKPATLVKIAAQLADYYQTTQQQLGKDNVENINCSKQWSSAAKGKHLYYSALAHLHNAQQLADEKTDFGEQQARLSESQRLLAKAKGHFPNGSILSDTTTRVNRLLEAVSKENQFIYHERVPEASALPELPKAALVKAVPVEFPLSTGFVDLFQSLVQPPSDAKKNWGVLQKVWSFLTSDG